MSALNKLFDKTKHNTGAKPNDSSNKNRPTVRPQGWANLGKINSRRIPPPANLPSIKSEIGVEVPTFDSPPPGNHKWNSNETSTVDNNQNTTTQQQIDSLPIYSSAPTTPADLDKNRTVATWSNITAGTTVPEPIPNLLGLNDFPRLANPQDKQTSSVNTTSQQPSPSFRPANNVTWKEGGGTRIQPLMSDLQPMPMPNNNPHLMQSTNNRTYSSSPMWAYPSGPSSYHSQQRQTAMNDYKTPTILRNKDIDDLSKLTDNTWANISQEVNYEEKLRFSDDEDELQQKPSKTLHDPTNRSNRRNPSQLSSHKRLIQDDEHVKQLQDNKNSELINALNVAKQRRDEQERYLKSKSLEDSSISTSAHNQSLGSYPMRPLMSVNEQENSNRDGPGSTSTRARHDTANSQTFSMKSWSDQMDSFNYASLHDKSSGHLDDDSYTAVDENNQSQSESNSPLPIEADRRVNKLRRGPQPLMQTKTTKHYQQSNSSDYQENFSTNNTNGQWKNRQDSSKETQHPGRTHDQQVNRAPNYSDLSTPKKSNGSNNQTINQRRDPDRSQTNVRSKMNSSSSQIRTDSPNDTKATSNNRNQSNWQTSSPSQTNDFVDQTPPETVNYKSQQRSNGNEQKSRYPAANASHVDTSSIPPLMSVRSDAPATLNLYNTSNSTGSAHYPQHHDFYNEHSQEKTNYYQSNNQQFPHTNRGYTALGSYGRYRRTSAGRQTTGNQQYSTYSGSASSANSAARQKKTSSAQKKSNSLKSSVPDEVIAPLMSQQTNFEPLIKTKSIDQVEIPSHSELTTSNELKSNSIDDKSLMNKSDHQVAKSNGNPQEKTEKEIPIRTNQKHRTHQAPQTFYQAPRHKKKYSGLMQDYEPTSTNPTNQYNENSRRTYHTNQNSHVHDGFSGYYYEPSQSQIQQQYDYIKEDQRTSHQMYSAKKKGTKTRQTTTVDYQPGKSLVYSASNRSKNSNHHQNSTSDNDQKEGEEWETASESSEKMRNGYHNNPSTMSNSLKSMHRGRTSPKKTVNYQRPYNRQIFKVTNT